MELTGLHIYPVKSLAGLSLSSSAVTPRGLKHDRRYILIDNKGGFLTQRHFPHMAHLHPEATENGWLIRHKLNPAWQIEIPYVWESGPEIQAPIWKDAPLALEADAETNEWFTDMLHVPCRLAFMPDHSHRQIDPDFSRPGEYVSFADGYPLLMVGESSLADLNSRMDTPVGMDRFRPNLVFTGDEAYAEDGYGAFSIGELKFRGVKTCARCVLTTVDPETAKKGTEPLKTLTQYRNVKGRIIFGMNVIPEDEGTLEVGMRINLG